MAKGRLFVIHWDAAEAAQLAAPLLQDGWEVELETEDGARAVRTIMAQPPDAVVVSLDRKPSHGRETVQALTASKSGRDIPVIFVGGEAAAQDKTRTKFREAQFVEAPGLRRALARYASL